MGSTWSQSVPPSHPFPELSAEGARALVGVKEDATEVQHSCPDSVEHLQASGAVLSGVTCAFTVLSVLRLLAQSSLLPAPLPRPLTLPPANE